MNLQLSLKKQWFEMTKAGIKTEDYREINPYWYRRLLNPLPKYYTVVYFTKEEMIKGLANRGFKKFDTNIMTLGYPKSTDAERILKLEHKGITIGYGNPEWGAEKNKLYFIIKHGKILN